MRLTGPLASCGEIGLDEAEVARLAGHSPRAGLTLPAVLQAADSVGERLLRRPEVLSERQPLRSLRDTDWS